MKVLIRFCKPYLRSFVWVFGLNVLIGCTELALPYLLMQIINGASAVHADGGAWVYASLWGYVLLLGAGILFKYWNQNAANQSSLLIARDLRVDGFGRLISHPYNSSKDKAAGDLITTLSSNIMVVEQFIRQELHQFIYQPVRLLGAIIFMLCISWKLLVVSLLIVPVSLWLSHRTVTSISSVSRQLSDQTAGLTSILNETRRGMKTIKAYQQNRWFIDKFQGQTRSVRLKELTLERKLSALIPVQIVISAFPYALCVLIGGYFTQKQQMNVGELVSFLQLLNYLVRPLSLLPGMVSSARRLGGVLSRIAELYEENEVEGEYVELQGREGTLSCDKVSYVYKDKVVLSNISFKADSPGITVIAGRSGSGKSTLVKLICGYDRPLEGTITLFGHDLRQVGFHSVAPLIAFVPQEPYIFPVSILDNIGYGRLDATREEVMEAATAAGVHRFVHEWPEGYDTVVSGEALSGGQRQRISIARALLKNAPVLIMDEPTSALDAVAEQELIDFLNTYKREHMIIIVSHRLATIKAADQLVILDRGQLLDAEGEVAVR
ncbi:ABC transporter ATP-binding protein [Paenibacillus sp. FSL R7-269]|uniref:ABC transporter ATP-binding protein n=1 Tax=Paenibacillus sp. FSL R7-269 TaxID=1226755 RepID=UPI000A055A11|nr:ABC transporter ATP-binding protein [Paenibacillus sp. FSL R7-269]